MRQKQMTNNHVFQLHKFVLFIFIGISLNLESTAFDYRGKAIPAVQDIPDNRASASSDIWGPYITFTLFIGRKGLMEDTLKVSFSEPVSHDSLTINKNPDECFKIYDSTDRVKVDAFKGAWYLDYNDKSEAFISDIIIITGATISDIIPLRDSISLVGNVVDTAGNYPDTLRKAPIHRIYYNYTLQNPPRKNDKCGEGVGLALIPPLVIRKLRRRRRK